MDFFTSLFSSASAPTRKNTVTGATASRMNSFTSPNVEKGVANATKNNVTKLAQPGGRRTRRSRSKKMKLRK